MAKLTEEALLSREKRAWSVKQGWQSILTDVFDYAMPDRQTMNRTNPGQRKDYRVYDSTAVRSTMAFANRIQSDLMPPFQRWLTLSCGPMVPEQLRDRGNRALEEVNERLFAAIQQSNFDTAINEFLLDLAAGTAAMLVLEGDDSTLLHFVPVPISQLALDEGPHGSIAGIFRKHEVIARNIEGTWKKPKLSDQLRRQIKDRPDDPVELIEVTYFDNDEKLWRYEVIYEHEKARLVELEFRTNPWIVTRWLKVSGEVFGRGPLVQAIADIKTLNKVVELVLKAASLAIAPPVMATDDGITNPNVMRWIPGAVIPVARTAGNQGPSLQPLDFGGNFNVAELQREQLQMGIKELLLDNQLPPEAGPVRSATEIVERVKQLTKSVGAPFGRLMSELIVPLANRVLDIMERRGFSESVRVNGVTIKAQVLSPLAQIQQLNDVDAFIRWATILQQLGGPEVLMLSANIEDAGQWLGEKLGVAKDLIRSEAERAEMQQAIAGMIAKQQEAQQLEATARAAA